MVTLLVVRRSNGVVPLQQGNNCPIQALTRILDYGSGQLVLPGGFCCTCSESNGSYVRQRMPVDSAV